MNKGDRVKLIGIVDDRGRNWESLETDFNRGVVGTVESVERWYVSRLGYAIVLFIGRERCMHVPIELLKRHRA